MTKKKLARKNNIASRKKTTLKRKPAVKKKQILRKKSSARAKREITNPDAIRDHRGLGSASGGQSGDTQGLSRKEDVDSESVTELAEEGQDFEAEAVSGVENAKDPDQGEVTTSEVPEDDVPTQYTDRNKL